MHTETILLNDAIDLSAPASYNTTQFHRILIEEDGIESGHQLFSTSFVKGDTMRSHEVLVVNTAFLDGPHTPMQTLRAELYAKETGIDVISVGIPGMALREFGAVDQGGSLCETPRAQYKLTKPQTEALSTRGSFGLLGAAAWRAVKKTAGSNGIDLNERKIHFLNYSAGVSTAAGMLGHAEEYAKNPGVIVNLEGAAYRETTTLDRLLAFTNKHEQAANKWYEAANPNWVPSTTDFGSLVQLTGNIALRPATHARLGRGFAFGKATQDLISSLWLLDIASKDIKVVFGNGCSSSVSPDAFNDAAARQLQHVTSAEGVSRVRWHGERHGLCNDLGRFVFEIGRILQ